ncbi:MAG: hypothetical protein V4574_00410 [Pseudomonadota bacterium]
MARRALTTVLVLIGLAAVALPGWAVLTRRPPAPAQVVARKLPTAFELVRLQAMADQACRCTRERKEDRWDSPCWDAFDKRIAAFDHEEAVAGCQDFTAGGETRSVCFGEDCLSLDRSPAGVCSAAERRAAAAPPPARTAAAGEAFGC